MRHVISQALLVLLACSLATALYGDCSAPQNCGECNSGNFIASCQCHDVPNSFRCTNCIVPPACTGVGCCCGVNSQGKTFCSSFSCGTSGECMTQVFRHQGLFASTSNLEIAAALFQSGEITNLDAPIEINTANSGIAISDFNLNIDHQKISGATFTIRNESGKPLIAYVIGIDFYWDISPKPCHASVSEDSWFLNADPLGPGEQEQGHFMSTVIPRATVHFLRVVVNLEYAEFSDGSIVGLNAGTLKTKFDETRRAKLAVQHYYADMLQRGTSPEDVAQQIKADLRNMKYKGNQYTALIQIYMELSKSGPDDLANKLLEEQAVPISGATP